MNFINAIRDNSNNNQKKVGNDLFQFMYDIARYIQQV